MRNKHSSHLFFSFFLLAFIHSPAAQPVITGKSLRHTRGSGNCKISVKSTSKEQATKQSGVTLLLSQQAENKNETYNAKQIHVTFGTRKSHF